MENNWQDQPGMSAIIKDIATQNNIYDSEVIEIVESFFLGLQVALNADIGIIKIRRVGTFKKFDLVERAIPEK